MIECGFEDEISIGQINESAIKKIEEFVRNNKELLKDTKFENKSENFEFLLGHRCLLLELPNKVRDFVESNRKRKGSVKINIDNIDEDFAKNRLIRKLNNYSYKFALGFVIRSEDILQLEKIHQVFKCKVRCPFVVCTVQKICSFKTYWEVSNFIKHVKTHYECNYEEISVLIDGSSDIQRIEDNGDLDDILR